MSSQRNACVQAYFHEYDPESVIEGDEVSVEVQISRLQQDLSEWLVDTLLSLFTQACKRWELPETHFCRYLHRPVSVELPEAHLCCY